MAGLWEIVTPVAGTNLITNPSGETNATGWTGNDATVTRSSEAARWGAYSIKVVPNGSNPGEGVHGQNLSLTQDITYHASIWALGFPNESYKMYLSDGGGNVSSLVTFDGDNEWHRYDLSYAATATTTYNLYIQQTTTSTGEFYVDGALVHASFYLETYIDGDQPGCIWSGTPHASTSTRDAGYRAGGRIINLDSLTAYVTDVGGAGMPPLENILVEYGQLDGANYQRTRAKTRVLSLTPQLLGTSLSGLHALRDAIIRVLAPNVTPTQAPFQLRYTALGLTDPKVLYCLLDDGLGGSKPQGFVDTAPIRLLATDPYWHEEGESSQALDVQDSATVARIARRIATKTWGVGSWDALGGGANGDVYTIAYDVNSNSYYVGGDFTTIGGTSATRIAKYDANTGTWSALSTGCNDIVRTIVVDPNVAGTIYVGGRFTLAGGVANTARVAKWDGSVWTALSTGGSTNNVYKLAHDRSHNLYAIGDFGAMGGVANTLRIAKWNGAAWSALGTGISAVGYDITIGADNNPYIVGSFLTANGVTVNGVAYWNGSTFVAMAGGVDAAAPIVFAITAGLDGTIFIGGSFTSLVSGVVASRVARWNGTAWLPCGTGLSNTVTVLYAAPDGNIYAGGIFTTLGNGVSAPCQAARWNSSTWLPLDLGAVITNGSAFVQQPTTGELWYGWVGGSVTGTYAAIAEAVNRGSADAYPRIVITGPTSGTAKLYYLANRVTGDELFFDTNGLVINAGEKLTLTLLPGGKSFVSTFQGRVLGRILGGSNLGTFRLTPGSNNIALFCSDSTMTAIAIWNTRHWSNDGVLS